MNKVLLFIFFNASFLCSLSASQDNVIGIAYSQNTRDKHLEDTFTYNFVEGGHFFGVFDGHGGCKTSHYLQDNLAADFMAIKNQSSIEEKMKLMFQEADQKVQPLGDGSTASVIFIKDGILHSAHVGDSRALVNNGVKIVLATKDHKATDSIELQRLENLNCARKNSIILKGPYWINRQTEEGLAISRSIGDFNIDLSKEYIISQPDYTQLSLKEGNNNYLVVASDGLWDVMSNEDVTTFINNDRNPLDIARDLLAEAVKKGSPDDITVMVVKLKDLKNDQPASIKISNETPYSQRLYFRRYWVGAAAILAGAIAYFTYKHKQ